MGLIQKILHPQRKNQAGPGITSMVVSGGCGIGAVPASRAEKLSAVFAAVDIHSGSMSVLPAYCYNSRTRQRVDHDILRLLSVRPNAAMTPMVRKKLLDRSRMLTGNAYDWIIRDPRTGRPVELIPVPGELVSVKQDKNGIPVYTIKNPRTGETFRVANEDICHYKGPSNDGIVGKGRLEYAAECIATGLAAQSYSRKFYESGGQPSGVLTVEGDLGGFVYDKDGNPTTVTKKDAVRNEWERVHSGAENAHRIAVLDYGMKYQPLSISQRDSQFVEQQEVTVADIARFFGVPLYKLQSGSQSYNANEQNAIEYLSGLQPDVTQMEEEQTYKLLSDSEIAEGLEIRYNMMSLLRSDQQSRASYYKSMWEIGVYSVNDIRALEDLPDVEGGDERMASLNYVPLKDWAQLSRNRNSAGDGAAEGGDNA